MKIMGNIVQDSNCPPRIMQLLLDQQRNLKESKTGRRWSKEIIRLCLTMWCRSPRAYGDLACVAADFSSYLHTDFFKSIKTKFTRKLV